MKHFHPIMPNGFSHRYQLEQSISVLRLLGGISHFYDFNKAFYKQKVETHIRRRILRRLIWVCTVCLCPTKRTLGLYGFSINSLDIWKEIVHFSHQLCVLWTKRAVGEGEGRGVFG